jgi:transposase, IS30 family
MVGRPRTPRHVERRFWLLIAEGRSTERAAAEVGVSSRLGARWFRDGGGMTPVELAAPSERFLSLAEREEIALAKAAGRGVRQIARELGRVPSTISRELARNRVDRGYRALAAQAKAEERARRPKPGKLAEQPELRAWVQDKLESEQWSPEQIAGRLVDAFPDDESMRISHEAIYQALYVQGRGVLRRELTACLRTGRALRKPRRRADARRERIKDKILISERPAEVEDRAVPGHWEGDLIIGEGGGSAIGTLVERSTRFVMLLHLPGDHGAEAVRDAIVAQINTLPTALRGSLTWDQGIELARHTEITFAADLPVYFCDPHSPWQRGTNENTNGLLRQYFPKGSDLAAHDAAHLELIAAKLNGRPRKTLGFKTPAEVLARLLSDDQMTGVATTS